MNTRVFLLYFIHSSLSSFLRISTVLNFVLLILLKKGHIPKSRFIFAAFEFYKK